MNLVFSNPISDIWNVKCNMVWATFLAFAMGDFLYWLLFVIVGYYMSYFKSVSHYFCEVLHCLSGGISADTYLEFLEMSYFYYYFISSIFVL